MRTVNDYIKEWAVWYSGDAERIWKFYNTRQGHGRFWGNLDYKERQNAIHMPLAQDICSTSAGLLFSEPPRIETDSERVHEFIDDSLFESRLIEAADMAAALGGVYIKIDTDPDVSHHPLITIRSPLVSKPIFKGGKLHSVSFYRLIKDGQDSQLFLVEHRENHNGVLYITFELIEVKGDRAESIDIDEYRAEYELFVEDQALPGVDGLGAVYIPNLLPNRLFPESSEGVSDYQGSVQLLDALDEVWTSWIRDIELGMARLLIDEDMLKSDPFSEKAPRAKFDPLQSAFLKLSMDDWRLGGGSAKPIEQVQFDIRYEEHSKTATDLTAEIVSRCGYAPQSFGLGEMSGAVSGSALKIRERKSFITRRKKARFWQHELQSLLMMLQQIDNASLLSPSRYEPQPVTVTMSDSIVETQVEMSETVRNLSMADAASTKIKVLMMNPDWTDEQVDEEVQRILQERGTLIPPDMIGG